MSAGNQIVVYDYYTQGPKTTTPETGYYIEGTTAESSGNTAAGSVWPFINADDPTAPAPRYAWTEDGVHKFFGWLVKDINSGLTAQSFFGQPIALNTNNNKLVLPSKTLDKGTADQLDFMYSDITFRNLNTEPDNIGTVNLGFKHLFTAFSIAAVNMSSVNTISLRSVTIEGMNTKHSATIDYSGDEVYVDYGNGANGNGAGTSDYGFDFGSGQTLDNSTFDLQTKSETRHYFLAWPTTETQATNITFTVVYRVNNGTKDESKTISLSNPWAPGTMNNVNIVFKDKEIDLTWEVVDWTLESDVMDFTNVVTIANNGKLQWSNYASYNENTGEIIVKQNKEPIIGEFKIDAPVGAIWTASLIAGEGHVDAFEFEGPNSGKVGDFSTIKIKAANNAPYAPTHKVYLRIAVRTGDGRTIVVNDLTPSGKPYHEFAIVQNMI